LANSACINALFRTDLFKEQIYLFSWYCLRDTIYTCRGGMNGVPSGILLFYRKLLWDSIFIPEQHLYMPMHCSLSNFGVVHFCEGWPLRELNPRPLGPARRT